jgi:hypothetical protein
MRPLRVFDLIQGIDDKAFFGHGEAPLNTDYDTGVILSGLWR